MRFIYQAKRKLATGHVLDDTYEILIYGEQIDPNYRHKRTDTTSLDGTVESELQYIDDEWVVVTDLINQGQELENFREFIASTAGGAGEPFTFDPTGEQLGVDDSPRLVWMTSTRFRESRKHPGKYQYSLNMREV